MNYTQVIKRLINTSFPDIGFDQTPSPVTDRIRLRNRKEALRTLDHLCTYLTEVSKNEYHEREFVRNTVDVIFNRYLSGIVSLVDLETGYWFMFRGRLRDALRLKCLSITYDPRVFVDGRYILEEENPKITIG